MIVKKTPACPTPFISLLADVRGAVNGALDVATAMKM